MLDAGIANGLVPIVFSERLYASHSDHEHRSEDGQPLEIAPDQNLLQLAELIDTFLRYGIDVLYVKKSPTVLDPDYRSSLIFQASAPFLCPQVEEDRLWMTPVQLKDHPPISKRTSCSTDLLFRQAAG